jgi:hypothetical protein
MSWPTSTTPTTYVDADTDPIWRARPHIKQDIDNVNAIIDTFDPSSPVDGARLLYNNSTTKFTTNTTTDKCIISFDTNLAHNPGSDSAGDDQFDFYTGGFTIENTNLTGITVGTNSDGHSEITFPQGSYAIEMQHRQGIGNDSLQIDYKENDTTTHFSSSQHRTGTQGSDAVKEFFYKVVVTFDSDTTVAPKYKLNSGTGSSVQHQDILITRIA